MCWILDGDTPSKYSLSLSLPLSLLETETQIDTREFLLGYILLKCNNYDLTVANVLSYFTFILKNSKANIA